MEKFHVDDTPLLHNLQRLSSRSVNCWFHSNKRWWWRWQPIISL